MFLTSAAAAGVQGLRNLALPAPVVVGSGAGPSVAPLVTFPTAIKHVFIVVLENANRSTTLSNGPFESSLQTKYAYDSKYYGICHPSAPNYLAMTSGKTYQCGSDNYNTYASTNLGYLAQQAGLSWGAFMESMPKACDTTTVSPYAVKHNPFVYYTDIVKNSTICNNHVLNFTSWSSDVSAGTIPNLGFFTPNLKNDGHDTGVAYADSWLKGWLSPLMNASFFQSSVFFITYDEAEGNNNNAGYNGTAGGNVYFAAVSPFAKKAYDLKSDASHYNLLETAEWLLGLGNTGNNDSSSKFAPMKSLFNFTSSTSSPLTASASASPTSGSAPLLVSFSGSASGGKSPYTYSWNYGGTTTSSLQNPTHTYLYSGSYTATLTITDSAKTTAKATVKITSSALIGGTPGTLVGGSSVTATTPTSFWSLDVVTNTAKGISSNSSITSYLASTPFTWVRYGVDSDTCNISANKQYADNGVASVGCGYDISALKTWCNSRTPHCHSILALPGENNNSAEDAAIAKWIVTTQGFQPDYWTIGNEPMGWTHYGIPWTSWKTTDASKPTSLAYAFDVKAAITAVTAVDSAAKFIGVEAACDCNTNWFQDVAKIDGSKISAIAYHKYPSTGSTSETTSDLYALLGSSKNLSTSYATVRAAMASYCTSCATMPIFVNEYNAGPGWAPSTVSGTYANAVFLAASAVQALRANVSQLSIYSLQTTATGSYGFSLLDSKTSVGPSGVLYSKLLSHLTVGQVLSTQVSTSLSGVWSVVTKSGTHESLLIVNTNQVTALALTLGTGFPQSLSASIYQWAPGLAAPTVTTGALALGYSVPAEGILLLTI